VSHVWVQYRWCRIFISENSRVSRENPLRGGEPSHDSPDTRHRLLARDRRSRVRQVGLPSAPDALRSTLTQNLTGGTWRAAAGTSKKGWSRKPSIPARRFPGN